MTGDLQWYFTVGIFDFKVLSYKGWLVSVYSYSALLVESLSRCVEKRITVDWLPKYGISKCQNALEQKLVCDLVYTVIAHKCWLIKMMLSSICLSFNLTYFQNPYLCCSPQHFHVYFYIYICCLFSVLVC